MNGFWGDGGPYATWARTLRAWAREEPVDVGALPRLGREEFPPDTWERFTAQIVAAVDTRLTEWSRRFTHAFAEAEDEFSAGRALTQSRAGLRSVRVLVDHPGLPDELRSRLADMIDDHIRSLQSQLEQTVNEWARSGDDPDQAELRLRTLRDNAFTAVLDTRPDPPAGPPAGFARLRGPLRRLRRGGGPEPAATSRAVRRSPPEETGPPAADHRPTDPPPAARRRIVPD
ncbi:hypothetical protein GA0115241_111256 [Streptomyces sp. DpondAA-D4]|nr:hypothetical protein GA0115241_111256 [Streptomyces sp. DpondAA-D4]